MIDFMKYYDFIIKGLIYNKIIVMSQERLPLVHNLKQTPADYDIALIMNNHKKRI